MKEVRRRPTTTEPGTGPKPVRESLLPGPWHEPGGLTGSLGRPRRGKVVGVVRAWVTDETEQDGEATTAVSIIPSRAVGPSGGNDSSGSNLLPDTYFPRTTDSPFRTSRLPTVRTPAVNRPASPHVRFQHPCRLGRTIHRPPSPRRSLHFAISPRGGKGRHEGTVKMSWESTLRARSDAQSERRTPTAAEDFASPSLLRQLGVTLRGIHRLPGFPPAGRPRIATQSR
jgi:hypothetical protein